MTCFLCSPHNQTKETSWTLANGNYMTTKQMDGTHLVEKGIGWVAIAHLLRPDSKCVHIAAIRSNRIQPDTSRNTTTITASIDDWPISTVHNPPLAERKKGVVHETIRCHK